MRKLNKMMNNVLIQYVHNKPHIIPRKEGWYRFSRDDMGLDMKVTMS